MPSCEPYRGLSRKLVLAFDVGTMYSGVSYCILNPGEISGILGVSRWAKLYGEAGGTNMLLIQVFWSRTRRGRQQETDHLVL